MHNLLVYYRQYLQYQGSYFLPSNTIYMHFQLIYLHYCIQCCTSESADLVVYSCRSAHIYLPFWCSRYLPLVLFVTLVQRLSYLDNFDGIIGRIFYLFIKLSLVSLLFVDSGNSPSGNIFPVALLAPWRMGFDITVNPLLLYITDSYF